MNRAANDHSGTYWPGYVDALVNVVLNLMFLAAILAIGSFSQGLENSRRRIRAIQEEKQAASANEVRKPAASAHGSRPQQRTQASLRANAQLDMRFTNDTIRLDERARERLKLELQNQIRQGVQYWNLSIDTDVNDNHQRRAAYLRMISVRNVFLEAGIDPARIGMRMRPSSAPDNGQQLLHIVPDWQLPESRDPASPRKEGAMESAPQPEKQEPRG